MNVSRKIQERLNPNRRYVVSTILSIEDGGAKDWTRDVELFYANPISYKISCSPTAFNHIRRLDVTVACLVENTSVPQAATMDYMLERWLGIPQSHGWSEDLGPYSSVMKSIYKSEYNPDKWLSYFVASMVFSPFNKNKLLFSVLRAEENLFETGRYLYIPNTDIGMLKQLTSEVTFPPSHELVEFLNNHIKET